MAVAAGGGTLPGVDSERSNGSAGPIDHLYLKNVILKFIAAVTEQRVEQVWAAVCWSSIFERQLG